MAEVDDLVSVAEAARRLGITIEQAYDLVFSGSLQTVASETGRRLVAAEAIEQRSRAPTADTVALLYRAIATPAGGRCGTG